MFCIYNLTYPHLGCTTSLWLSLFNKMGICSSMIPGCRDYKEHTVDGGGMIESGLGRTAM